MTTPRAGENTALSLYQLIGAPLHALIDAESQAAQATADFIRQVGFVADTVQAGTQGADSAGHGEFGRLRMVSFLYERQGADGARQTYRVEIPLLALVPIPALQIKDASIEFNAKIVDSGPASARPPQQPPAAIADPAPATEGSTPRSRPEDSPGHFLASPDRVDFKATLGSQAGTGVGRRSREIHLKLKINIEQADVPTGLSRMFNLLEQGITQVPDPGTSSATDADNTA